ncbi:MT-A70 family methyltransferase [Citrobacter freundii]|uniref:MT-A70 family methyltransferase n=1 Tax=Citrobacter freundii TaxID=546 RepID=UPI001454E16F
MVRMVLIPDRRFRLAVSAGGNFQRKLDPMSKLTRLEKYHLNYVSQRQASKVVEAWGFKLMTMKGFTWHKTNKHKGNSAIGMGHMTRANSEDCLFAVRGKLPARMDASICQHITAPRLENSRKPDIIREKLVQLLGDVPRIELFARQSSHGFDVWGNQCDGPAVQLLPGCAIDVMKVEAA